MKRHAKWLGSTMISQLFKYISQFLFHKTVGGRAGEAVTHATGGLVDIKLGWQLLRDRRVPAGTKCAALALGGFVAFVLQALEFPLEGVLAFLMPLFGLVEMSFDGLEVVGAAVLVTCLVLPALTPRPVLDQVRGRGHGKTDGQGRVYDAVAADVR